MQDSSNFEISFLSLLHHPRLKPRKRFILYLISNLDRLATHLTILDVRLLRHRHIQHH